MDSYFHLMVDKRREPVTICHHLEVGISKMETVQKPLSEQTDDELRHNIAQRQIKMQWGKATDDDRKQFDTILDEILRRRNERQNG